MKSRHDKHSCISGKRNPASRSASLGTCFFAALAFVFLSLTACAGDHFFPRLKPLFVGLDESKVPAAARVALAQAKEDFQLARHGKVPSHARYVSTIPYTHSRVYEGKGYRLTMVSKDLVTTSMRGPEIMLEPSITGGKPCRYDEIDILD